MHFPPPPSSVLRPSKHSLTLLTFTQLEAATTTSYDCSTHSTHMTAALIALIWLQHSYDLQHSFHLQHWYDLQHSYDCKRSLNVNKRSLHSTFTKRSLNVYKTFHYKTFIFHSLVTPVCSGLFHFKLENITRSCMKFRFVYCVCCQKMQKGERIAE
jgi:hypothetical protein